jgi:SAM-dependent methyltransferase
MKKSTVDEIRERFDADVDRFSNLETGQAATLDARLAMDLIAEAAAATTPRANALLDVGCGAGNYTLRLLEHLPDLDVTRGDLSRPMLDRAVDRITRVATGTVATVQSDVREYDPGRERFDIVIAAAVVLWWLQRSGMAGDLALAMIFYGGIALGYLLMHRSGLGFNSVIVLLIGVAFRSYWTLAVVGGALVSLLAFSAFTAVSYRASRLPCFL